MICAPRAAALRRDGGLRSYERALTRHGLGPVAGVDEAGRGACAGPLVVAAVVLPEGRRGEVPGLADSKLLTPAAREEVYTEVVARALAWSAVVVPAGDVDRIGLHVCNVAGMRRAVARLERRPGFVLTDGFPVPGIGVSGLAVWKGDRVAACVAAASVVAKVTRDRLMVELHRRWPHYDFATHKGYVTPEHGAALRRHGPCPEHRFSFVNVARVREQGRGGGGGLNVPVAAMGDNETDWEIDRGVDTNADTGVDTGVDVDTGIDTGIDTAEGVRHVGQADIRPMVEEIA